MLLQKCLSKQCFFTAEYIYNFTKKANLISCSTLVDFILWDFKGLIIWYSANPIMLHIWSVVTIYQVESKIWDRKKGNLSLTVPQKGTINNHKRVSDFFVLVNRSVDGKNTSNSQMRTMEHTESKDLLKVPQLAIGCTLCTLYHSCYLVHDLHRVRPCW